MPGDIVATPGGQSVDIDLDTPTALQMAQPSELGTKFLSQVPDEYKEQDWVKGFAQKDNPMTEMMKEFHNQRSLIGKKAEGLTVPSAEATPEDWNAFHKAIGVPEKPEDYAYTPPKAPEGLEEHFKTDDNLLKVMREAAIKAGVRGDKFGVLAEAFDTYYADMLQKSVAEVNTNLKQVEDTFKAKYGERSGVVLENSNKLNSMAPDWAKPVLESLPPAGKAAVASLMDEISKKYMKEDSLDMQSVTGSSEGVMSVADYGDQYEILFAKMRQHPIGSAEHMRAKGEMAKLQARGREVFAKK